MTKKIIVTLVIIAILYLIVIKPLIINTYLLSKNHSYAKVTVMKLEGSANGEAEFDTEYWVNNKKYSGFFPKSIKRIVNVGDCYLIEYYPPNPSICEIRLDKKVNCDTTILSSQ